ncbi:MAG: dienelactone hydrolase family protein [Bacteroidales bacterium]|nr:dienelactone hydrolase family protein [Bacteroidales bacterium]
MRLLSLSALCAMVCTFSPVSLQAAVKTEPVEYSYKGVKLNGVLAYDDAVTEKRPGVLVVHEWWGLNDYALGRAKQLAELGYVAFACDMYGGGKTVQHPKEAGEMASAVRKDIDTWVGRAKAALDVLKSNPRVDSGKLATIGYCFGGSTALQLAFSGADLDAVATFHGAPVIPSAAQAQHTKAKILIAHGADDPFIKKETLDHMVSELKKANVHVHVDAYPGAVHSFTVPTIDKVGVKGLSYNKSADEKSWAAMKALFAEKLGSPK